MEGLEVRRSPPHIGPEFAIIDCCEIGVALSRRKFAIRALDAACGALDGSAA